MFHMTDLRARGGSDAANTLFRADGQQGIIPAYDVADFSFEARVTEFLRLEGSLNNIGDTRYFTARDGVSGARHTSGGWPELHCGGQGDVVRWG